MDFQIWAFALIGGLHVRCGRAPSILLHGWQGLLRQFLDQGEAEVRQCLGALLYVVQIRHASYAGDQ